MKTESNYKATKKWKKKNPKKVREQEKRYRKKNREKINERQKLYERKKYREEKKLDTTKYRVDENGEKIIRIKIRERGKYSTRFAVLARDDFTCQYCGRKAPFVVLEIDHKTPKSKGGSWRLDNLVTSCFDCNRGKGNTIIKTKQ